MNSSAPASQKATSRPSFRPDLMTMAQALAEKGDLRLNAIAQAALAIGIRHLEGNGSKILGLPPSGS